MRIEHPDYGQPLEVRSASDVARRLAEVEHGERDRLTRLVTEGTIFEDDGTAMPEARQRRERSRMLGPVDPPDPARTHADFLRARGEQGGRWLIPDLWKWGHVPALAGNHKAGKTTLICELTAALIVPGRLPLGGFGPATWTEDERDHLNVWLINAETPSGDFTDALEAAGVPEDAQLIRVDLEHEAGGAGSFDLTDPVKFDFWAEYLTREVECIECGEVWPDVLLVDGVTAILGGSTSRYAEWFTEFRRLLREIGCPNGLASGHATMQGNHMMGGVEMLGAPDGLWNYWAAYPDDPTSRRYFRVQPRLGGAVVPTTEVRLGADGRLVLATEDRPRPQNEADDGWARAEVIRRLTEAEEVASTVLTGRGDEGTQLRAARDELAAEGLITSRRAGATTLWRLV